MNIHADTQIMLAEDGKLQTHLEWTDCHFLKFYFIIIVCVWDRTSKDQHRRHIYIASSKMFSYTPSNSGKGRLS